MKKSFIKKIFSFNKSKEQEMEKTSIPHDAEKIAENEYKNIKNDQPFINKEKEQQGASQNTTSAKSDGKTPSFEPDSDKVPHSGKIIVTDIISEKKKSFHPLLLLNRKK